MHKIEGRHLTDRFDALAVKNDAHYVLASGRSAPWSHTDTVTHGRGNEGVTGEWSG